MKKPFEALKKDVVDLLRTSSALDDDKENLRGILLVLDKNDVFSLRSDLVHLADPFGSARFFGWAMECAWDASLPPSFRNSKPDCVLAAETVSTRLGSVRLEIWEKCRHSLIADFVAAARLGVAGCEGSAAPYECPNGFLPVLEKGLNKDWLGQFYTSAYQTAMLANERLSTLHRQGMRRPAAQGLG